MDSRFRDLYPTTPNRDLATLYGVPVDRINDWAARLGLHKAAAYRREVQRANARIRRLTREQRDALAAKARGRTMSAEAIAKALRTKLERGSILRGDKHPNWKGGRPWERFRDERYLRWRNAVLARDAYVCQRCGRRCRKHERGLAAHHVSRYATDIANRYEIANGLTLCRSCHMAVHGHPLPPPSVTPCACGCGTLIAERDRYGRSRRYVNHHHSRGRKTSELTKAKLRSGRSGKTLSTEHRARISHGLRTSPHRIGRPPKT